MEESLKPTDLYCAVCKKQNRIMKRCTRCHAIIYCSRECQKTDWPSHKKNCITKSSSTNVHGKPDTGNRKSENQYKDDGSIFEHEEKDKDSEVILCTPSHPPLVDFRKASHSIEKDKISLAGEPKIENQQNELKLSKDSYLFLNEICNDVPELDQGKPFSTIIVKSNREKQNINIQNTWTGEEIFKVLACKLKIPLDVIKLIHKGKVMNFENIQSVIANKALFQAIGEQAANEEGLNSRDIELMMKQLKVNRNEAVLALKRNRDVIDAILEIGNK